MNQNAERVDTDVVVVGSGPGGCTLAYLLARSGVETLLVERHTDLAREFRGYGFMPDAVRLFDEMGLADDVLDLPHEELRTAEVVVHGRHTKVFDFTDLSNGYDYAVLMEQPPLLELSSSGRAPMTTSSSVPGRPSATSLSRTARWSACELPTARLTAI